MPQPLIENPAMAQKVARVLKAIAHPVRLQIIELLESGEMCVGQIVDALHAKYPITSQQLNTMCDRGVLTQRRDGAKVFYRILNPSVSDLLQCLYRNCDSHNTDQT
ncbi:MAG: helix-turn-helix transcriptional regulator [Sedimentisphaerales bacterium]|nr:helix-turn-helix transcriptional regulator [Sedimentisphaerales bacterium]